MKHRFFSNGKPLNHYFKSSVWSGIKTHIGTVLDNSLWIVGTGENISLWNDNWLGTSLVVLFNVDMFFHAGFTGKVSDIIVDGGWNLPPSLMTAVVTDKLPPLPCDPLPDTFVWSHSADGKLSLKLAIDFLKPTAPKLPWADLIWKGCIPPSHSFTFWRLLHGKMPTDENLRARGCVIVSACCFCLKMDETSEHLFLQCPFATDLWSWLGGKLNCSIDCTSALSLLSCLPAHCSSQTADIFLASVIHTVHTIWLARNSMRFSSQVTTFYSAKVRIHSWVALSGNTSTGKCLTSDSQLLDVFLVDAHCRTVKEIIPVLWKAPSSPWLKVNTDGSVIAGHAACGGLFRDSRGSFLGAFCCNIGEASVYHSEVLAIILAMEHASAHGWRQLWLESDSTSALLIFSNPSLVPVMLRNRWHNARSLGIQVISSHIFREGNCCADRLANMGHSLQGSVWLDVLPAALYLDFFRERVGLPNYRFP
jgi:ribonuclease HI